MRASLDAEQHPSTCGKYLLVAWKPQNEKPTPNFGAGFLQVRRVRGRGV
jgi:hypothetical protein